MGGRARISPSSLWVREEDGEIREGLLFRALVARHVKRFQLHEKMRLHFLAEPHSIDRTCRVRGLTSSCLKNFLLKALLWGGSRAPGGGNRGVVW